MKTRMGLAWLLALCLLLSAAPLAGAEEENPVLTSGDFQYVLQPDGTAMIIRWTRPNESYLSIPAALDDHPVTAIGDEAFYYCTSLTSVDIPDTVQSIGSQAFLNCSSLTEITIPDSVTTLGRNPFSSCEQLTKIRVSPDHPTLAVIDGVLFSKPEKVLVCYPYAFTETKYEIPRGIRSIGAGAFRYCNKLERVVIPDTVTRIDTDAFWGCDGLTQLVLPDSLEKISENAFWGCNKLTEMHIPEGMRMIGVYTFAGCTSLRQVTIPSSVVRIDASAFAGCSSLSRVTMPASVTEIDPQAFLGCSDQIVFTLERDSYGVRFCRENGYEYEYTDALDWLND